MDGPEAGPLSSSKSGFCYGAGQVFWLPGLRPGVQTLPVFFSWRRFPGFLFLAFTRLTSPGLPGRRSPSGFGVQQPRLQRRARAGLAPAFLFSLSGTRPYDVSGTTINSCGEAVNPGRFPGSGSCSSIAGRLSRNLLSMIGLLNTGALFFHSGTVNLKMFPL